MFRIYAPIFGFLLLLTAAIFLFSTPVRSEEDLSLTAPYVLLTLAQLPEGSWRIVDEQYFSDTAKDCLDVTRAFNEAQTVAVGMVCAPNLDYKVVTQ